MRKITSVILITSSFMTTKSIGQSFPQWGKLTKGNYTVGYKDTVFFITDEQYS